MCARFRPSPHRASLRAVVLSGLLVHFFLCRPAAPKQSFSCSVRVKGSIVRPFWRHSISRHSRHGLGGTDFTGSLAPLWSDCATTVCFFFSLGLRRQLRPFSCPGRVGTVWVKGLMCAPSSGNVRVEGFDVCVGGPNRALFPSTPNSAVREFDVRSKSPGRPTPGRHCLACGVSVGGQTKRSRTKSWVQTATSVMFGQRSRFRPG